MAITYATVTWDQLHRDARLLAEKLMPLAPFAGIVAVARGDGLAQLSLETGALDYFRPAHALYARHGFVDCAPFEGYVPDPNSRFMTLRLAV